MKFRGIVNAWRARGVRRVGFGALGEASVIEPPFRVVGAKHIHIGRDVRIRSNVWSSVIADRSGARPKLTIGDRCVLGADLVIA
jgi:acetyltransferase-like isoleucine patch superfamily enzyme